MICEKTAGCPFYNNKMMVKSPSILSNYKKKYCEGDKNKCARYKVFIFLGANKVPNNLYPNMVDRANEIIGQTVEFQK